MELKIEILKRDELRLLLRNGKTRDTFLQIAFKNLLGYQELITNLEIDIPCDFTKTTKLKNDLQSGDLELSSVTQIICVLLSAPLDEKPSDRIDYSIEDIQKFFVHLNKEQLKNIDLKFNFRKRYNTLLDILTNEKHPFGKISLDENWNIHGKKCKPIEDIEKYIVALNHSSQDKSGDEKTTERESTLDQIGSKKLFKRKRIIISFVLVFMTIGGIYFWVNYQNRDKKLGRNSTLSFMILPFERNCSDGTSKKNVGELIRDRLEVLKQQENLDISIEYFSEKIEVSKESTDDLESYYQEVLNHYEKDFLILGSTIDHICSTSGKDEICINYYTRSSLPKYINDFYNKIDCLYEPASISGIASGDQITEIDFIIYSTSSFVLMEQKKFEKAILLISKIIDDDKSSESNKYFSIGKRGLMYFDWGMYSNAISDFDSYLAKYSEDEYYLILRHQAKYKCGLLDAYKDLNKIIEVNPNSVYANTQLTIYYLEHHKTFYRSYFSAAINNSQTTKEKIEIYQLIISWHIENNFFNKAKEFSYEALSIMEAQEIRFYLGLIYLKTCEYEQSLVNFDMVSENSIYWSDAMLFKFKMLLEIDRKTEAIDVMNTFFSQDQIDLKSYFLYSYELFDYAYHIEIVDLLTQGLNEPKLNPAMKIAMLHDRMVSNIRLGNFKEKIEDSLKITEIDPNFFSCCPN